MRFLLFPIGAILALIGFLAVQGVPGSVLGWVGVCIALVGAVFYKRFPQLHS